MSLYHHIKLFIFPSNLTIECAEFFVLMLQIMKVIFVLFCITLCPTHMLSQIPHIQNQPLPLLPRLENTLLKYQV